MPVPSPSPGVPVLDGPRPGDVLWMARALEMARCAALRGEVPVGAVLVRDDALLAEGFNHTITWVDPTAHAEVVAIRAGARRTGDWRLTDCTLYVTLEPCALCAGAIVLARIPRVVFGAPDHRFGMAVTLGNLLQDSRMNHRAELTGGVLAEASAALLRGFFRARRSGSPSVPAEDQVEGSAGV